jgi:hypothetical protein
MRAALALTFTLLATTAWAVDADQSIVAIPQEAFPDVIVIGKGWPANMTNGCLDRHECEAPQAGAKLAVQPVLGPAPSFSDIPKSADSKAAQR